MLTHQRFLFIDCQTTGMHPSTGQLLEIAWCFASADDLHAPSPPPIHSALIAMEGSLPWRVQEITGLKAADFTGARALADVQNEFKESVRGYADQMAGAPLWSVIHYAQFERAFLEVFLGAGSEGERAELPFQILCTHMIAKRLFPQAPSRNIRALSGFMGSHVGEVKRAAEHVRATLEIWKGLQPELSSLSLSSADDLLAWSKSSTTKRAKVSNASYEYRVDRAKRLALPSTPGVYRMLSKTGRVLYVGKATCLKDRVNSYFRGRRGRDPRKLEMMAQTWDLQVTECASALEAAVLESDEIKRHDPPYNVSLKNGRRKLLYYDRDFTSSSASPDAVHRLGPYRAMNPIEEIKQLIDWKKFGPGIVGGGGHLFYGLYDDELVQQGYAIFVLRHPLTIACGEATRSHLAYALTVWRTQRTAQTAPPVDQDAADGRADEGSAGAADDGQMGGQGDSDQDPTPEEMAEKFERLYLRAAQTLNRTRMINHLMNSRIRWRENDKDFELTVNGGHVVRAESLAAIPGRARQSQARGSGSGAVRAAVKRTPVSWAALSVSDYDRMSVLASELSARAGQIFSI